jgi:hypothetical protein
MFRPKSNQWNNIIVNHIDKIQRYSFLFLKKQKNSFRVRSGGWGSFIESNAIDVCKPKSDGV